MPACYWEAEAAHPAAQFCSLVSVLSEIWVTSWLRYGCPGATGASTGKFTEVSYRFAHSPTASGPSLKGNLRLTCVIANNMHTSVDLAVHYRLEDLISKMYIGC